MGSRKLFRTGALALVSGVVLGLGFQPFGYWPLVFLGVAGFTLAVRAIATWWRVGLVGLCFGLGLAGTTLNWMSAIFVSAMVAIVIAVALFYVALAWLLKLSLRWHGWPLLAAGCWALIEYVISRWPFDGFGWVRLGYAMIDSPLAGGYPIIGLAGVSFTAALLGELLAAGALWCWERHRKETRESFLHPKFARPKIAFVCIFPKAVSVVLLIVVAFGFGYPGGEPVGEVNAGWVQGGAPGGGVFGLGEARTITKNETAGTQQLAKDVAAGKLAQPDFVIWPENGTDLDPNKDAPTRELVQKAQRVIAKPMLIGAIATDSDKDERQTVSLWWQGSEQARYVKRSIVPFGEWIPMRDVLLNLIPELKYVGAQSIAGTEPGVMPVQLTADRGITLGIALCYDVAFDEVMYDLAAGELLVVQSSNAMYQGTGQIEQQFAMTRVRAAELRREIIVVTTSGISGYIDAFGNVVWSVPDRVSAYGVQQMPLRENVTWATWFAGKMEVAVVSLTLLGLVVLAVAAVRTRALRGGCQRAKRSARNGEYGLAAENELLRAETELLRKGEDV